MRLSNCISWGVVPVRDGSVCAGLAGRVSRSVVLARLWRCGAMYNDVQRSIFGRWSRDHLPPSFETAHTVRKVIKLTHRNRLEGRLVSYSLPALVAYILQPGCTFQDRRSRARFVYYQVVQCPTTSTAVRISAVTLSGHGEAHTTSSMGHTEQTISSTTRDFDVEANT